MKINVQSKSFKKIAHTLWTIMKMTWIDKS
jgi:hypothetical protein